MGELQKRLSSDRLVLEPLVERHADGVVLLFADPAMSSLLGADLSDPALAARLGFLPVGEGHHYNGPHRVHVAFPGRA
jgi:hypothetical protein